MNIGRWLSIPYKPMGRTKAGCDCWGFVRLVLMEERDITLPSYDGTDEVEGMRYAADFVEIASPMDWCLVKMEERKGHLHVGLYLEGFILHMTQKGVVMQREQKLYNSIKGYYSCV